MATDSKCLREMLETAEKIKSALRPITREEIAELEAQGARMVQAGRAACSLALRRWREKPVPRRDRVWTGRFNGRRAYRNQPVVLPDGSLGFIYGILRGMAAIWIRAPFVVGEKQYLVLPVDKIKPYRLPSAIELGRQKAGVRETSSERKAESCRKNGSKPVRPGHRPRGRPRKIQAVTDPQGHHHPTPPAHPDRPGRTASSGSGYIPPTGL